MPLAPDTSASERGVHEGAVQQFIQADTASRRSLIQALDGMDKTQGDTHDEFDKEPALRARALGR